MCTIGRYTLFLDAVATGDAALQSGMESLLFDRPAHRLVTTLTELSLPFLLAMLNYICLCSLSDKSCSNNTQSKGDACGWKRSWPVLYYCSEFGEIEKHYEEHQTAGNSFTITLVPNSNTAEIKKNWWSDSSIASLVYNASWSARFSAWKILFWLLPLSHG